MNPLVGRIDGVLGKKHETVIDDEDEDNDFEYDW